MQLLHSISVIFGFFLGTENNFSIHATVLNVCATFKMSFGLWNSTTKNRDNKTNPELCTTDKYIQCNENEYGTWRTIEFISNNENELDAPESGCSIEYSIRFN